MQHKIANSWVKQSTIFFRAIEGQGGQVIKDRYWVNKSAACLYFQLQTTKKIASIMRRVRILSNDLCPACISLCRESPSCCWNQNKTPFYCKHTHSMMQTCVHTLNHNTEISATNAIVRLDTNAGRDLQASHITSSKIRDAENRFLLPPLTPPSGFIFNSSRKTAATVQPVTASFSSVWI